MTDFQLSTPNLSKTGAWRGFGLGLCATLAAVAATAAPAEIALPGDHAFPENITSANDGTLYVGSLGAGGIFRVKPHTTQAQAWIKPGAFDTNAILGVLADDMNGMLWACSNDLSGAGITNISTVKGAFLKGFDLKTGKGKVSAQLPGDSALCNDIAIGPDGAAYVTDTSQQHILRLPKGGTTLELWLNAPEVQPPEHGPGFDGLAFGTDGNVYVDTYGPADIYRVDVTNGKAGKLTKLTPSRKLVLADAIRPLTGNSFLLIEGGGSLDKITVNGDQVTVETLKDGFDLPTGVALVGKTAWVSEGQLSSIFNPAKKGTHPKLPFKVFAVPYDAK